MTRILIASVLLCFTILACRDLGHDSLNSDIDSSKHTPMKCVFFFIPDCPASKLDMTEISKLQKNYGKFGLSVSAVLSDPAPNDSVLQRTIKDYSFEIPIIYDSTLAIAKNYGATTTPQVFLFDSDSTLVYSGQITNYYYNYGKHKAKATKFYLEEAILSLRDNKEIEIEMTSPIGCKINFD